MFLLSGWLVDFHSGECASHTYTFLWSVVERFLYAAPYRLLHYALGFHLDTQTTKESQNKKVTRFYVIEKDSEIASNPRSAFSNSLCNWCQLQLDIRLTAIIAPNWIAHIINWWRAYTTSRCYELGNRHPISTFPLMDRLNSVPLKIQVEINEKKIPQNSGTQCAE